jgi:chaperonin GroES
MNYVLSLSLLQKSAGGLILAGSSSESLDAALTGTIVAVGDEVEIDVAAGDQVLYTKYGSSDIETDEGNVSFVVEKSILAKLT